MSFDLKKEMSVLFKAFKKTVKDRKLKAAMVKGQKEANKIILYLNILDHMTERCISNNWGLSINTNIAVKLHNSIDYSRQFIKIVISDSEPNLSYLKEI